jgi:23S rRNA (adenine-N6)-dimethyltransferase
MYSLRRRPLSQNFLWNRELVRRLVRESSISPDDTVVEIGPGKGIITAQLLRTAKQVIAIELDEKLFGFLQRKFAEAPRLTLLKRDFLTWPLPSASYKVFSNIPFAITGDIIRKLLLTPHAPLDSYLVIQAEAAHKFIAHRRGNTMAAMLYYPWFDLRPVYVFQKNDFRPPPKVNACLLRIEKRAAPLVPYPLRSMYQDFVVYHFTRDRFARHFPPDEWVRVFHSFAGRPSGHLAASIRGAFARWRREQQQLSKIHRTRTDQNWRRFKLNEWGPG